MKKKVKVLLASPRGFCAGVDRAVEIVNKAINKFGTPVYVRHEIVHNKHVVETLEKKGAIFIDEIDEIKDRKRPVIFSAHGVPKQVINNAKKLNLLYVDATCPLVTKVHREAEILAREEYNILFIGHKDHPEVIGTLGQIDPKYITLIENKKDVNGYKKKINNDKIAYITQTTLSVDDTKDIVDYLKEKFKNIREPIKSDICYATSNRQEAVKEIARKCDIFFIIGSRRSSNSKRLVEVAKKNGCKNAFLIHSDAKIPYDKIKTSNTIGLSSGASAPEILVKNLLNNIQSCVDIDVEEISIKKENISFKLPSILN